MDLPTVLSVISIVVLLFMSGLLSGSETALTASSRARLHQLEKQGNSRARRVRLLRERPDRLIGSILLGNNLVNILASALATSLLINWAGDAGVVYATVIMTALVLIFAEVMPKTYALNNADRAALSVAPIIEFLVAALAPAVTVVQHIVYFALNLLGRNPRRRLVSAEDELRGAFDLHTREGGIVKNDRDMLDSILDLPEVAVFDIMIHRSNMVMIDADQPADTIIATMLKSGYSRVPLWRNDPDNIVGILHVKDVLERLVKAGGTTEKLDLAGLVRKPWYVPDTTTLREQLNAFRRERVHFALVVDEYGSLMGLLTLEDILEEIVGEITDEYDEVSSSINHNSDGSVLVDGTLSVRDLNRACDWELPEDEAATIAGLVIHHVRHIPEAGERLIVQSLEVDIVRRQRNRLTKLRLKPLEQPKSPR